MLRAGGENEPATKPANGGLGRCDCAPFVGSAGGCCRVISVAAAQLDLKHIRDARQATDPDIVGVIMDRTWLKKTVPLNRYEQRTPVRRCFAIQAFDRNWPAASWCSA